jgi:hypothetical protein
MAYGNTEEKTPWQQLQEALASLKGDNPNFSNNVPVQNANGQVPMSEWSFGNTGASTDFMDTGYNLGTPVQGTSGMNPAIDQGMMGNTLTAAGKDASWWDSFASSKSADGSMTTGWGGPALGIANTGMNAYLGLQNLKLAKDSLKFQKDSFSKQFENQRTLTNAQLRDRQLARDSATGRSTTDAYMKQNGV